LKCAGRIGDGVILQFADPHLIKWCLGLRETGRRGSGRDFSKIRVMSATRSGFQKTRKLRANGFDGFRPWCRIMSSIWFRVINPRNCLRNSLPISAIAKEYNYLHHAEVAAATRSSSPTKSSTGSASSETLPRHTRKLQVLRSHGVTQFNIYLMCGEEEKTLEIYGRDIIPSFSSAKFV